MPNIVIVSTAQEMTMTYNDTSGAVGLDTASVNRSDILRVCVPEGAPFIQVMLSDAELQFSFDGANAPQVDTVDAVPAGSNANLAALIAALAL